MPLWLAGEPLVLASKSAIRRTLLCDAGVPVEVEPADIDERRIEQRSAACDAGELAALLAREKARTIAARRPGRLVLGADQRSEEHTSELQSLRHLVCRLLL